MSPCVWTAPSRRLGLWATEWQLSKSLAGAGALGPVSAVPPRAAEPGEAPGQRPRSQAPGGNCGRLRGPLCRASPVEAPDIPALDHGATLCRPLVTASSRSALSGGGTRPAPAQPPPSPRPLPLVLQDHPRLGRGPPWGQDFSPLRTTQDPPVNTAWSRPLPAARLPLASSLSSRRCLVGSVGCWRLPAT